MAKLDREALKKLLAAALALTGAGLWTDVLTIKQAGRVIDITFDLLPQLL